MTRSAPPSPDDWVSRQLQGRTGLVPDAPEERRSRSERRRRILWSVLYGSFNPRRRRPPRRGEDSRYQSLDWHGAHLLAVSIAILILNVADALFTVTLISRGAIEANPVMAALVRGNVALFAVIKMALTGASVILMVCLARYRFMRLVRVEVLLYGVLMAYAILIGHEIGMLHTFPDLRFF